MNLSDVRSALVDAFEDLSANRYAYVPGTVPPPAITVQPGSPYIEPIVLGKSVKVNLLVTATVAALDNEASLNQLEDLMLGIWSAMPAGYKAGVWTTPGYTQMQNGQLLGSQMTVEVAVSTEEN